MLNIERRKQPKKYMAKTDGNTRKKLDKMIADIQNQTQDCGTVIKRLTDSVYFKASREHYRIIFTIENETAIIEEVNTRGNIDYRRYTVGK